MWIRHNANPLRRIAPDCVVRAIGTALHLSWYEAYDMLSALARAECSMPSDDKLWGLFLFKMGFKPFLLPKTCPDCITVRQFSRMFPSGTYIIGTGSHAVAVIDGDYYDTWDSGDAIASFFWTIKQN